jgi:PEP-CTERM motif
MKTSLFAAALVIALAAPASTSASVLTQWNFNANDLMPSFGSGAATALGTTSSFASGAGSTDPADPDLAWNTTNYPSVSVGDKTEGVQFMVSTAGMTDVMFSFDNRQSNTGSKYLQVQYTINGTTFVDAAGGLFAASAGGVWNNINSVSFVGVAGADNNASFGLRIVTTFAPGTGSYVAANPGSSYGTSGTVRLDMVTVMATAIPEPGTWALLIAGLGVVAGVARRRAA